MSGTQRAQDPELTPLDAALAMLHRHWSRTEKLCGWAIPDQEYLEQFQEWRRMDDLTDNREDLRDIREAWNAATQEVSKE